MKTISLLLFCSFFLYSNEIDIEKLSEALGYMVGKNINSGAVHFNMDHFIKGIEKAHAGEEPPLSDTEYAQELDKVYAQQQKNLAQENRMKATRFLTHQKKSTKIISGKLHYTTIKTGTGAVLKKNHSPLLKISGHFLDGTMFYPPQKQIVPLQETLQAFQKGTKNMREGEIRRIFIHPDLWNQANDSSLVILEVELLNISSPADNLFYKDIVQKNQCYR
ncbi:MAG: hypothetical protein JW769_04925 [Parachlamydiales bacterium]|nr:hypothetical protein [Parachlamydiales bacterium]